jgi:DNA polymerase I
MSLSKPDDGSPREAQYVAFDLETNGLFPNVTKVHCLSVRCLTTGDLLASVGPHDSPGDWGRACRIIGSAAVAVGHNAVNFDARVLRHFGLLQSFDGRLRDTLLIARILFPDIKKQFDFDRYRSLLRRHGGDKEHPTVKQFARIMGQHSLKAWGIRLGIHKGDYGSDDGEDVWAEWTPEMHEYMDQDTLVTVRLWEFLSKEAASWYGPDWVDHLSIRILHRTAEVTAKIEEAGWPFDEAAAAELYARLAQEREDLSKQLVDAFGTWVVKGSEKTPVRNEPKYHRTKDHPYTQVHFVTFNPRSLDHMAKRLTDKYGWVPEEFTDSGKPKLDEGVLGHLAHDYPECSLLSRFLMVNKRIAALAEGKQAWMRHVRSGKIHAGYRVNGTLSGRASHANPNIAQVPATGVEYGHECRALFGVPKGWIQVGADMSGLELRCFAHYLAKYDKGAYGTVVTQGDVHTSNQGAAGLPTRGDAKTFIYAFLYGAGDRKIGSIVKPSGQEVEQVYVGRALKAKFTKRTPGLSKLTGGIKAQLETSKYLTGLDGRRLFIREKHAALNTLLQSAGAIICAAWMCAIDKHLSAATPWKHGWDGDYVILGWIHDELQFAARNQEVADYIGNLAKTLAQDIGDLFDFQCPLDGEFKKGSTWADTH